ncbi:MAG: radical SAM protein [Candidatus Omnitrophica bacterium]|nr:radical SAM protein [Candidatus Omnitrophota bacterium]
MKISPYSGGLIISYQCNLACIHCLYNCRPSWKGWAKIEDIDKILSRLCKIKNFNSLHLTGGEPFMNLPLLIESIKLCKRYNLSFFVETNCYWAKNEEYAEKILRKLKEVGLNSILLSYSIFYADKIPIENFEIAMEMSFKILGRENVSFYTLSGYQLLKNLNFKGKINFEDCLKLLGYEKFVKFLQNYIVPKGKCLYTLENFFYKFPPEKFKGANCIFEFLNPYHIHIDLYENYIPSFCAGITLGNFEKVLNEGINRNEKILNFLMTDIYSFLIWAENEYGYKRKEGYINKCHLCLDIRKYLIDNGFYFDSLKPIEFYHQL